MNLRFPLRERRRPEGCGAEATCHASGRLDDRRGNGAGVDMRATAPNWPTFSDESGAWGVLAAFVVSKTLAAPTWNLGKVRVTASHPKPRHGWSFVSRFADDARAHYDV